MFIKRFQLFRIVPGRHLLPAYLVFGLVLLSSMASAQLVPKFSYTKSEPCFKVGTIVNFKDESQSDSKIINWIWDFGDGKGVLPDQENPTPRRSFDKAGVYRVTLTVTNASFETKAISQYVVLYPEPVVSLNSNINQGCSPLSVQLKDLTTMTRFEFTDPVSGEKKLFQDTIKRWSWDFGDGSSSIVEDASVNHTYKLTGNMKIRLTISTKEGCQVVGQSPDDYIKVLENADANFYLPPPSTCQFPVEVPVSNMSQGATRYKWSISGPGVATISNDAAENPTFSFPQPGTYSVRLRATAANGCVDQAASDYVLSVGSLTNKFSGPDSSCDKASVQFFNQTQPVPVSNKWYVNGEEKATTKDFIFLFPGPGTYKVKLESQVGLCNLITEKSIRIDPVPTVDFTADITSSCNFPQAVNFTDRSSGTNIARRIWAFGDGFTRTEQAPLQAAFRYVYNRAGNFNVGLSVVSDKGCIATKVLPNYVSIQTPVILKSNLPDSGCAPLKVSPSVSFNIDGAITSWEWTAKDITGNTIVTSNKQFPDPITFTESGKYVLSLRIRTASGCDKTYNFDVKVGTVPENFDFSATPTDACASTTFQFKYLGSPVTGYKWNFSSSDSTFFPEPARKFKQIGKYDIALTVYNNGCPKVVTKKEMLNVRGVIAKAFPYNDCVNPLEKWIVDASVGNITSWEWNFGDGLAEKYTTSKPELIHIYDRPGEYKVTLRVTGDGCEYIDSVNLIVANEKNINFNPSKLPVCVSDTFMTLKASIDNPKFIKSYEWNFGCGFTSPTTAAEFKVALASLCNYPLNARRGNYTMQLRVVDVNNCVYLSPAKDVFVGGPVINFNSLSAVTGCVNLPVQFQDKSTGDGTYPVVSRLWDFGDGTPPVNIPNGPVQFIFEKPGLFPVSLTITDQRGCKASNTSATVRTIQPDVDFISLQPATCLNKNIQFQSVSSSVIASYRWDLGDGKISTQPSPTVSYQTTGKKNISLAVKDIYGCESNVSKSQFLEIDMPVSKFRALKDTGFCPPFDAKFVFEGKFAESMEWEFGDGSRSSFTNPSHLYLSVGKYQVKLKVTSPGGCQSTSDPYTVVVKGPEGTVDVKPYACRPYDVEFNMNSSNTKLVTFDYGDGNVTDYLPYKDKFNYKYADTGLYQPKVFITSADGCTINIPVKNTIRTVNIQPVFKPDTTFFCKSGTVRFTDLSLSNDIFTKWSWDFGDGGKGATQNISHEFLKAGAFDVKLVVTSSLGCKDSLVRPKLIEIREKPEIDITASKQVICEDDVVQFEAIPAAGTNPKIVDWFWDFTNGISSSKPKPEPQQFRKVGSYPMRLYVKDDIGCKDTLLYDFQVNPVPLVDAGPDKLICKGTPVQLSGTGNALLQWSADPALSCIACKDPFVNPSSDAIFYLRATAATGCVAVDSVKVNVVQPSKVMASRDTGVCIGNTIRLQASGTSLYRWAPASGLNYTDIAAPVAKPDKTTSYVVTGTDPFNCFSTKDTVIIQVYPNPLIDVGRDTTIMAGYPLQLNATYSPDVVRAQWMPSTFLSCANCKTPVTTPSYSMTYTLFAYSDKGCVSKDVVNVFATCTKENIFIPNTFSPNGDGMNDVFYPRGRGIEKIKSFSIFNRWGQMIYRNQNFYANDPGAGWNGSFTQKPVTPDVYVYMIEVICENGNIITLKGDVTLVK